MDQKNTKKKIDEFCDLYDMIRHATKHGDYETVKAATKMLTEIHELFLAPRIIVSKQDLAKAYPVYDPHGHPHEPLPPDDYYDSYEGQWVKEYHVANPGKSLVLPGGINIHDHVEHQQDWNRECEHEPIEVGFNFSRVVCKKCDKELPKEALYGKKTFQ